MSTFESNYNSAVINGGTVVIPLELQPPTTTQSILIETPRNNREIDADSAAGIAGIVAFGAIVVALVSLDVRDKQHKRESQK